MRKLRVWYSDPDATDDSSDEVDRRKIVKESPVPVKRLVHLVDLADVPILREIFPKKRRRVSNNRPFKSPYVGVRQRKWGTWAAEIRNPFTKTRIWLGTFGSAEVAQEAYLEKRAEFDAQTVASFKQKEEKQQPVAVSPSSQLQSDCSVDISSSDSSNWASKKFSDTDLGNRQGIISLLELGSAIIDKNGFLLGEFRHLDDLRICDLEEGNPG